MTRVVHVVIICLMKVRKSKTKNGHLSHINYYNDLKVNVQFIYFGLLQFILVYLVHFNLYWSNSVCLGLFGPIQSTSVHFSLIWSIRSISVHFCRFGSFQCICLRIRKDMFGLGVSPNLVKDIDPKII